MSDEIDGTLCTIARGGAVVGRLAVAYTDRAAVTGALRGAGYECDCEEPQDLKAECTEDDHEVCDLSVSLVYASEIAADTGTPAPELDALQASGRGTKAEVLAAIAALRDRLPDGSTEQAEAANVVASIQAGSVVA